MFKAIVLGASTMGRGRCL